MAMSHVPRVTAASRGNTMASDLSHPALMRGFASPHEAVADDLLHGADAIARFLFGDQPGGKRRVYYLTSEVDVKDRLPVFRFGKSGMSARKSKLRQWIADREGRVA
jgi:hypothetical protein